MFAAVGKHFGRIDVVFNSAGFGVLGRVELARSNFEVIFWGAVNLEGEQALRWTHFAGLVCARP